jgi:hypothetical protein
MDDAKDTTIDLTYAHDMLDFREFIRFGFHENIIPTFLTADELVFVF